MPKRKPDGNATETSAFACGAEGCTAPGAYKAPRARDKLHEYTWYCLDHIREYNQQWDYFADMEREEIESFVKDAVTGHRPTWKRETQFGHYYGKLQDSVYAFLHGEEPRRSPPPAVNQKIRKALAVMDMDYPFTFEALKAQYRVLVKRLHPDANKGNKATEEKFKLVTAAYRTLTEYINNCG